MSLLTEAPGRWAVETPDQVAFRFADRDLSYAELWRRAGQLARTLQDQGIKPGDRVGIHMHKCIEVPIAVYGVLRAGAVYVPLDPNAPPERLAKIANHCGIRFLVVQNPRTLKLVDWVDEARQLRTILGVPKLAGINCPSLSWEMISAADDEPMDVRQSTADLAYIIFTSGSTGTPKGISHTHRSGGNYARLAAETYGLTAADRLGNHAPLHFDISTMDYLAGPLVGAATVLIPEAYTKLPASLSQLVERERLTIWYSVPYALVQLLARGSVDQRDMSSLRWVIYGGEPFPVQHLYRLMELWPHARFSNSYGPAEVNQCAYYHLPVNAPQEAAPSIPIGSIWGTAKYLIVNQQDQTVKPGEAGELLVCTPTMMQGYWEQPELNARAFYNEIKTDGSVDCYYRTGDLAYLNDAGVLEYVGRKDRQIKIRGYRVELDEIESALATLQGVLESGCYPVVEGGRVQAIEASIRVRQGVELDVEQVQARLKALLPSYALPRQVDICEDLPRTTSGKVDRKKLQLQAEQRRIEAIA